MTCKHLDSLVEKEERFQTMAHMTTMTPLLSAPDLRHELGLYTVYSASLPALDVFRDFQNVFPQNPMRFNRENRAELRGIEI